MWTAMLQPVTAVDPERIALGEGPVLGRERWEEVRRVAATERLTISALARRFDLDRKTVRRCLRQATWQPYQRPARTDTLLAEHMEYLRGRAPAVQYSARVLYQELRQTRGYTGSYDTVKRFVQPLRAVRLQAERALVRFETPPGQQSQIDWGQARVHFRHQPVALHVFVLTLGFSRRSFYRPCLREALPELLDSHERAFEYFGGHTREHLYDRPRTVCLGGVGSGIVWNPTFRAFAAYWSFEPRVCQPYRAQTKGKVEAGVKYFRRNFLPGRTFVDFMDFDEQLTQWMGEIADVRVHGTTHERPIDRFAREAPLLIPTASQPSFQLEARQLRVVAADYLVSVDTNRYSVPFTLIGQPVEVLRRGESVEVFHRGTLVASHPVLPGKHQLRILPEHGPGAIARLTRQRRSSAGPGAINPRALGTAVEIRDLAVYDALSTAAEESRP
jgi:transposase